MRKVSNIGTVDCIMQLSVVWISRSVRGDQTELSYRELTIYETMAPHRCTFQMDSKQWAVYSERDSQILLLRVSLESMCVWPDLQTSRIPHAAVKFTESLSWRGCIYTRTWSLLPGWKAMSIKSRAEFLSRIRLPCIPVYQVKNIKHRIQIISASSSEYPTCLSTSISNRHVSFLIYSPISLRNL